VSFATKKWPATEASTTTGPQPDNPQRLLKVASRFFVVAHFPYKTNVKKYFQENISLKIFHEGKYFTSKQPEH
jgi:hypothetical protein